MSAPIPEQLRALLSRVQSLREKERLRIAGEIHDHPSQLLTAMSFEIRLMEQKLAAVADPVLREALLARIASMRGLLDETVAWAQKTVTELKPILLERVGFEAAVEAEAEAFAERTGIACEVSVDPPPVAPPKEISIPCFRIYQDILSNIAKHANARNVAVQLRHEAGQLIVEVTDDGIGIPPDMIDSPKALGLMEMKESARGLGGAVTFEGAKPHGTAVTIKVPFNGKDGQIETQRTD